jgi:hypothetical protein
MQTVAFLLSQLPCLLLALSYPYLAAKKDAIQIEANGSFDSLKKVWHSVNVLIRVAAFGSLGIAADAPVSWLLGFQLQGAAVLLAYYLFSAAIFWLLFDYRLNTLRGLEPGYVGQNADADKLIMLVAQRLHYTMEEAGRLLKWASFSFTGLGYAAACFWFLVS